MEEPIMMKKKVTTLVAASLAALTLLSGLSLIHI